MRRNDGEKTVVKLEDLEKAVAEQLELVHHGMYEKAKKNLVYLQKIHLIP